jgi:hypothetical protein
MKAADLPTRIVRLPGRGGPAPMILTSQAAANAACEQVGWVTTHPRTTTTTKPRSTTMPDTTNPPKVKLSCNHSIEWPGTTAPVPGDKSACPKCPKRNDITPMRTIKAVTPAAPGQPLDSHPVDVKRDEARVAATSTPNGNGPDAQVIQFPDRIARTTAAKAAAKAVRDAGGTPKEAGKASDAVMAAPIQQAPVQDRSDSSRRAPVGRITGLKLSGARTVALQVAMVGGADVREDERDAAAAIQLALTNDAKRIDLDAAGVRVLLRNLPRVAADESTSKSVVAAAAKAQAWLTPFSEAAGYAD